MDLVGKYEYEYQEHINLIELLPMLAGRSILFFGIVHAPQLSPVFSSGIQRQNRGTHNQKHQMSWILKIRNGSLDQAWYLVI
jgi:hypothetical protein